MKFTNDEMLRSIMMMRDLHETGKLGYAIARNMRKMTDASKEFMDIREQLLQKYGTDTGDGKYTISSDNAIAFSREISEYSEIEHDVDVFCVDEDTFTSGDLDSQQMYVLEWMVSPKEDVS